MEKSRLQNTLLSRRVTLPAAVTAAALAAAGCGSSNKANAQPTPNKTPAHKTDVIHAESFNNAKIGYDVSYPNGNNLPKPGAFAVVGLNGENAITFNPSFKSQIAWAKRSKGNTSQPKVALYVHTDNPLAYKPRVADYPNNGKNVDGTCTGTNSKACAYQYGENTAKKDVVHATGSGVRMVWLDVEGAEDGYTWESNRVSNSTVLEGMTVAFEKAGDKVGIYSGDGDWAQTIEIGKTPKNSDLAGLPDWILGATDLSAAEANCRGVGLTGKIVMAQIAGKTLDRDISCS